MITFAAWCGIADLLIHLLHLRKLKRW
jgi:hypothetical protein